MKTLPIAGIIIASLFIFYGLVRLGIVFYGDVNPRIENVKRESFEQTQSYVQGKIQELSKMRREYKETTDEAGRAALREAILSSASTVDINKLPIDLQNFINELQ